MRGRVEGGRLVLEGEGTAFLKLKAELVNRLGGNAVERGQRGTVSLTLMAAAAVSNVFASNGVVLEDAAGSAIETMRSRINHHCKARDTLLASLESGRTSTGSHYWDAVLDPHQGIAVNALITDGLLGMCLFDEQGTGKTVMTLAAFDLLKHRGVVDGMIVVAPKNMQSEWCNACSRFLPNDEVVTVIEGDREKKFQQAQAVSPVYVINFEGLVAVQVSMESIAASRRMLLVVDESFLVKNPDAMRSGAVWNLRTHCSRAIVLCGTPAPNHPNDIVHQFSLADGGYAFGGVEIPDDPAEAAQVIMRVADEKAVYLRRLKQSVLPGLPDKTFSLVAVSMEGRQLSLYEETRDELVLFLKRLDNSSFQRNLGAYWKRRMALLQICVSPRSIDPLYGEDPAKYRRLDLLIEEIVERGNRKIVVWSYFRFSLDDLHERYHRLGLVRVDGSVSSVRDRAEAVRLFQEDPGVRVFLGNPAAAGAGLTLHAAADAVYVSYPNQTAHYLQSLDRIHRRGQDAEEVNYYLLVCENSIETGMLRRFSEKEITQAELLGDAAPRTMTLAQALAELE